MKVLLLFSKFSVSKNRRSFLKITSKIRHFINSTCTQHAWAAIPIMWIAEQTFLYSSTHAPPGGYGMPRWLTAVSLYKSSKIILIFQPIRALVTPTERWNAKTSTIANIGNARNFCLVMFAVRYLILWGWDYIELINRYTMQESLERAPNRMNT